MKKYNRNNKKKKTTEKQDWRNNIKEGKKPINITNRRRVTIYFLEWAQNVGSVMNQRTLGASCHDPTSAFMRHWPEKEVHVMLLTESKRNLEQRINIRFCVNIDNNSSEMLTPLKGLVMNILSRHHLILSGKAVE